MKRSATLTKHAHLLAPGDQLLGKGDRARIVTNVARSVGLVFVSFKRGTLVLHPLDRVRVRI